MAVSLPDVAFQITFPEVVDQISVSGAGNVVAVVEYGDPFWRQDMRTKPLRASQRLQVEAFRDACRGGLITVHYTPRMCVPKAYWGDAGASVLGNNGALASKSGYDVTVNSVDNGLVLSPGDLISFTTGDYNWMARVNVGGTSSGNAISLTLNMPAPSFIQTGAVVRFKDIIANMRMLPGSFDMPDEPLPVASFTLFQVPK